ncbi:hypothetical protein BJX63DRAFT_16541 [Aspergillus granulosus]|uniref:Uncharacterized protein n=1 Tax=Aspergillus granulosus TaxID=176169 RepID=A0ABR4H0D3_9EURO
MRSTGSGTIGPAQLLDLIGGKESTSQSALKRNGGTLRSLQRLSRLARTRIGKRNSTKNIQGCSQAPRGSILHSDHKPERPHEQESRPDHYKSIDGRRERTLHRRECVVVWLGQESKQAWDRTLSNHVLAISRRRTREEKEEKGRQATPQLEALAKVK